jgi:hypothetical protein
MGGHGESRAREHSSNERNDDSLHFLMLRIRRLRRYMKVEAVGSIAEYVREAVGPTGGLLLLSEVSSTPSKSDSQFQEPDPISHSTPAGGEPAGGRRLAHPLITGVRQLFCRRSRRAPVPRARQVDTDAASRLQTQSRRQPGLTWQMPTAVLQRMGLVSLVSLRQARLFPTG